MDFMFNSMEDFIATSSSTDEIIAECEKEMVFRSMKPYEKKRMIAKYVKEKENYIKLIKERHKNKVMQLFLFVMKYNNLFQELPEDYTILYNLAELVEANKDYMLSLTINDIIVVLQLKLKCSDLSSKYLFIEDFINSFKMVILNIHMY